VKNRFQAFCVPLVVNLYRYVKASSMAHIGPTRLAGTVSSAAAAAEDAAGGWDDAGDGWVGLYKLNSVYP
jgi:hypothetical protein